MKKANHTNEEMNCKQCLHYNGCLKRFRNAKENGIHESMNEEEYFSHANECDFYISDCKEQDDWISANNPPEGCPFLWLPSTNTDKEKLLKDLQATHAQLNSLQTRKNMHQIGNLHGKSRIGCRFPNHRRRKAVQNDG